MTLITAPAGYGKTTSEPPRSSRLRVPNTQAMVICSESKGLLSVGVFSLPVGVLSARFGVRRMLIASMFLSAVGFVALPLAELASAGLRSSLLLATYFLGYFGLTIWAVNANPFLAAAASEEESDHAFSLNQVLSALGAFVGSFAAGFLPGLFAAVVGSSLEEPAPYRYTLLFAGALLLTGIPLLAATTPHVVRSRHRASADTGKAPLALMTMMSLVGLLSVIGEGTARTFFNAYLDTGLSVSTSRIGTLAALAQLLGLPAAMAMPLLVARIGKEKMILFGYVARSLCLLPLALFPRWLAAGGSFIGVMTLVSLSRPAFTAFHQESVQPRWRATISGATTMTAGLGFAAAAFGGGLLVTAVGYRGMFLIGAAISLVGALIFWAYFVVPDRRATEEPLYGPAGESLA